MTFQVTAIPVGSSLGLVARYGSAIAFESTYQ